MAENIFKLQPDRTIQLRGFDALGAAAAVHSATPSSFEVSGVFRDPADFAVLTLYDCDNFYEHPSLRYLPDTNFAGLTLDFDVHYAGLHPIDSPRWPTIDWPYIDVITSSGETKQIKIFPNATVASGSWTPASASFTIVDNQLETYDRVTLWYLGTAFDFLVTQKVIRWFVYYAGGAGTVHKVTINGVDYTYTEVAGDTHASVISGLAAAAAACPLAALSLTVSGGIAYLVVHAKSGQGQAFTVASESETDTLYAIGAAYIAADLAAQCNATDWVKASADIPLHATVSGSTITFTAVNPGEDGNALSMYAVSKNDRLATIEKQVAFIGGSSDVTWHVHIDFSHENVTDIRRMWMTFAPPIPLAQAFTDTEWKATFTNWTVSGPSSVRLLKLKGSGSRRFEHSDTACTFDGDWTMEAGFYSLGYAKAVSKKGAKVTIRYESQTSHELWLGTALQTDRGRVSVTIDGVQQAAAFDTYLSNWTDGAKTVQDAQVVTRRKLSGTLSAGAHTVVLTTLDDNKAFYFDYLDVVVPTVDVPASLTPRGAISPALDYSTDHTYKLPPSRIHWMFDKLGFGGPMNEYIGVFWWNQRKRTGNYAIQQWTVTFTGTFVWGDEVWLDVSGTKIGKSIFSNDALDTTNGIIARHFANYVNSKFVGMWASASGNVLTLTSHSPTKDYCYTVAASVVSGAGHATAVETRAPLLGGTWSVDPAQSPALNRAARDWHADFFANAKARNRTLTVAASMELVNPPAEYPARYHNGDAVTTDVGFASLSSQHCAFNAPMLAYQKQVFDCIAGLQAAAGLGVEIQFGEYCWWYFKSKVDGSMALYDDDTKAAAQAALGRPLALFTDPDNDPSINGSADAVFLRNRLRDHIVSLRTYLAAKYPGAKFEVLYPYDVNYPRPAGVHNLGGRLLNFINFPVEWASKATSGFDRMKMEGLDWGSSTRSLDLVREVLMFPINLGWPRDSIRYMLPIFNGGCPWISEYRLASGLKYNAINLWAYDHVCIFGWDVAEPRRPARAWRA